MQKWACAALCSLATNDANQVKIAALGGIEALLKAMGAHPTHAEVQEQTCRALGNLAGNDANRVKIAALGGIEAILDCGCSGYGNLVASLVKQREDQMQRGAGVGLKVVGGSASGACWESPTDECAICMTNQAVTALVPCWHRCVCEACAPQFVGTLCPLCRQPVTGTQRIY